MPESSAPRHQQHAEHEHGRVEPAGPCRGEDGHRYRVARVRITVLGKSPAWQDAGGACSGYLVEADGCAVLLDCGCGVFGKLRSHREYWEVDAVVISHLHADHILDLVPYASALTYAPRQQPVPVGGHPGTDTPGAAAADRARPAPPRRCAGCARAPGCARSTSSTPSS